MTPNKSVLLFTMAAVLAVPLLSNVASSQESSSRTQVLFSPPAIQPEPEPAPTFRVGSLRLAALEADNPGSDGAPSTSASSDHHEGFLKRSIRRIGQDQRQLYRGPFEAHNLKWDALVLVGTGAFLAAD